MTSTSAMHRRAPAEMGALGITVGLGAAGWAVAVYRMGGMDMGPATTLGSFPFFLSVWVPMMAAMMLPGLAPASLRLAARPRRPLDVPIFIASYLAVWALVGTVIYVLYRPHGAAAAGAVAVAAGLYELTPLKRRWRRSCRDDPATPGGAASGWHLGLCCVGSSIGLMLVMVAFGAMSLTWMAGAAAVLSIQKILPPRAAVDIPLAAAIVVLGLTELTR
jgi:predicted metal-binding membrane protein